MKTNKTTRYILIEEVWHGFTRPAGTIVERCDAPTGEEEDVADEHGNTTLWFRDPNGKLLSAMSNEVKPLSAITDKQLSNYFHGLLEFRARNREHGDSLIETEDLICREIHRRAFQAKMKRGKEAAANTREMRRWLKLDGGAK